MFADLYADAASMRTEVLTLGAFTDFGKLLDVLSLAADNAEDWEDQLAPVEDGFVESLYAPFQDDDDDDDDDFDDDDLDDDDYDDGDEDEDEGDFDDEDDDLDDEDDDDSADEGDDGNDEELPDEDSPVVPLGGA